MACLLRFFKSLFAAPPQHHHPSLNGHFTLQSYNFSARHWSEHQRSVFHCGTVTASAIRILSEPHHWRKEGRKVLLKVLLKVLAQSPCPKSWRLEPGVLFCKEDESRNPSIHQPQSPPELQNSLPAKTAPKQPSRQSMTSGSAPGGSFHGRARFDPICTSAQILFLQLCFYVSYVGQATPPFKASHGAKKKTK